MRYNVCMDIPTEYANRVRVSENGCWNWTGWISGFRGETGPRAPYGVLQINKKRLRAHRHFYELATGEPIGNRHVHHQCGNTLCVNPDHLEAIPQHRHNLIHDAFGDINHSNLARSTCSHGHPWTEANTYYWKGIRQCRACNREGTRRWREVRGIIRKPKTACPKGHPYEGDNVAYSKQGHRRCRACNREWHRNRKLQEMGGVPQ